jgi:hypothetical protein
MAELEECRLEWSWISVGTSEKDLGSKFPIIRDSNAALDVQDAIIDYAACGIIDVGLNRCAVSGSAASQE